MSTAPVPLPPTMVLGAHRRLTLLAVLSFVCGLGSTFKINIVGEVYLTELMLPVVALIALSGRKEFRLWRSPAFRALLFALMATFAGYALSDFIRETPSDQVIRGWGRVLFLATDFLSLSILVAANRRNLWWFALGFGVGGVAYLRFVSNLPFGVWKHGYADVVSVGYAAVAYLLPPLVGTSGFVALALYSVKYDFRIQAMVSMLIAALYYRASKVRTFRKIRFARFARFAVIGLLGAIAAVTIIKLSEDDYNKGRREYSNAGREIGILFGLRGIASSPIIGAGSWGGNSELLAIHRETAVEELGANASLYAVTGNAVSTHSQLLQSWLEGGILGVSFFLVLAWLLVRAIPYAFAGRPFDAISAILMYYHLYGLWHLGLSGFVATSRLQIALSATTALVFALEQQAHRKQTRAEQALSRPSVQARAPA